MKMRFMNKHYTGEGVAELAQAEENRRAAEASRARPQGEWNPMRGEFIAPEPTRRDVLARLEHLAAEIRDLEEAASLLEKRLGRILEPHAPQETNESDERPVSVCELGSMIESYMVRIRCARRQLERLEQQVQL